MKTSWWFMSLTVVAIAWMTGCAREIASTPPSASSPAASIADTHPSVGSQAAQPQALQPRSGQTPLTVSVPSQSSPSRSSSQSALPVPNLIPPTASAVRVPQSEVGRPDPFATFPVSPTVTIKPSANPASANPAPAAAPSIAAAPAPTLPSLPTVQSAPITQFPPVSAPNLPAPQPLSETIEISGIVEVGGRTSVIVKSPDERTSRYVHVGEYIGNGAVLVKRVETGMDPVVVLEENGAEVTRYVGGGSSLAGLL